jgi:hypothetical protein
LVFLNLVFVCLAHAPLCFPCACCSMTQATLSQPDPPIRYRIIIWSISNFCYTPWLLSSLSFPNSLARHTAALRGANVPAEPRFYPSFPSLCLLAYDLILIGFLPPDIAWCGYIYSIARKFGCEEIRAGPANLFCVRVLPSFTSA